jgi:hypothetical protein
MKITKILFLTFVSLISVNTYAGSSERALIASKLFNIPASNMNYDYNPWGTPWAAKAGKCQGYDGGHSGLDIQTTDKSTNRAFYALANGKVTSTGGTYNTISVYDSANNRTVLYLHASKINVSNNKQVNAGDLLGYQGDKGATGAFHVHVEVRSGNKTSPACGASTTINPETVLPSGGSSSSNSNYDGGDPNQMNCSNDAETVKSYSIKGGKIELRWSNSCKTNWARVVPSNSSAKTSVTVRRESDGKTYSYSGTGQVYSPMVLGENVKVCASGKIANVSGSGVCY